MTHNDNPTWSPIDTPKPVLPDVSIPSTRRHSEIFPITIPDHLSNLPTSAVSAHAHSHRKSWSSATIPLEHFHHLNGFTSSLPAIVSTGSPPDNAPPRAETVEEKHSRLIKEHIPDFDLEDIGTRTVGPLAPGLENVKNILVTGGAGFIGSFLVRKLVVLYPEYRICVVDKLDYCGSLNNLKVLRAFPNYTFIKGDITSSDFMSFILKEKCIDVIFHLAAQTHVDNSFGDSFNFTRCDGGCEFFLFCFILFFVEGGDSISVLRKGRFLGFSYNRVHLISMTNPGHVHDPILQEQCDGHTRHA
ncbi:hypothetical protein BC938DRAFT_476220 [Jimgerdemannia flammicorona]|uniref:NAD(P)-binding domain-containing protein n=1 Tax=Jimgerdemannia flammicorona TaxID=994334 RepID=A0A433QQV5_9FUNG|nr:hypothetical protein BC938DRAFT_476220 [Jimgerdemannia flammicorona]